MKNESLESLESRARRTKLLHPTMMTTMAYLRVGRATTLLAIRVGKKNSEAYRRWNRAEFLNANGPFRRSLIDLAFRTPGNPML